ETAFRRYDPDRQIAQDVASPQLARGALVDADRRCGSRPPVPRPSVGQDQSPANRSARELALLSAAWPRSVECRRRRSTDPVSKNLPASRLTKFDREQDTHSRRSLRRAERKIPPFLSA